MTGVVNMVARKCGRTQTGRLPVNTLGNEPPVFQKLFSIPPLYRKIRLNISPRAVAEMRLEKIEVRKEAVAPTRMESTRSARIGARLPETPPCRW